jgi:succinoglycan biosynthesis protein ExoA
MNQEQPATAIIVPTLNEEHYIVPCLSSLLAIRPDYVRQIIVVDGGSTDRTVELVQEVARAEPVVSVLHNPKRLQSAAVNLAARLAAPEVRALLRADAHAVYPPGFIETCIAALGVWRADSVVVPVHTVGVTGLQRAVAAAQNSRLGNGGSAHRTGTAAGRYVEHGHHAAFDRDAFLRIGGYDETFSHNEDAEFDHRLCLSGGRIWMAEQAVTYFPRRTFVSLAQQYRRNGAGRARTIKLHRMRPRLRQLMPLILLAASLGGLALMPESRWFGLVPLLYALCCLAWGIIGAIRTRDAWLLAMGPAAITMHMAWAVGFIRSWLERPLGTATGQQWHPRPEV